MTALDQFNNTATGYSGTVHFTSSDGQAVLPSDSTLTNGAVGPAVAVLQKALHISADRAFGSHTRASVVAAQRRLKLPRTGVVDAATWAALGLTGTPACVAAVDTAVGQALGWPALNRVAIL